MQEELDDAVKLHQAGRLAEAEAIYRRHLAANPNEPQALHLLGLIAHQSGHHDKAVGLIQRAIANDARVPAFHMNLGSVYRALGNLDAAMASFVTVIQLDASHVEAHNSLGLVQKAKGDLDAAEDSFKQAVRLQPAYARAWSNLGLVLQARGQLVEARNAFQQAIQRNPNLPAAHSNLGNVERLIGNHSASKISHEAAIRLAPQLPLVHLNYADLLREQGEIDQAITTSQQAIRLAPGDPHVAASYGRLLRDGQRHEDALQVLERCIRSHPNVGAIHAEHGQTLAELGKRDEAIGSYRRAIELDPGCVLAWVNLATYHAEALHERDTFALAQLVASPHVSDGERSGLEFARANVFDQLERYEEAADCLARANELQQQVNRRRGRVYDPVVHREHVDQIMKVFDASFFDRVWAENENAWGSSSRLPINIVGMPRSGTTLTEQILAAHSKVGAAGELRLLTRSIRQALGGPNAEAELTHLVHLPQGKVREAADSYLAALKRYAPVAVRITDKLPENYLYLGWLSALFPSASLIHCQRHDGAIAFSCWMTSFEGIVWANDPQHIRSRLQQYHRLMEHWRTVLGERIYHIDYETTVSDLESTARKLIEFVGLDWEPQCIDFHTVDRPVGTASVSQVRAPLYQRSLDRWKHYVALVPELFA